MFYNHRSGLMLVILYKYDWNSGLKEVEELTYLCSKDKCPYPTVTTCGKLGAWLIHEIRLVSFTFPIKELSLKVW